VTLKYTLYVACAVLFFLQTLAGVATAQEAPFFEIYPACSPMTLKEPNLKRGDTFWNFRTALRTGTIETCVNFNAAFTLIQWGCGTECQSGAIVDRTDGAIYGLPTATGGYDYRADSSLLIVNPHPTESMPGSGIPDWLWREFYQFKNSSFVLIHQDKGEQQEVGENDLLDTPHPVNPEILESMELN